MTTPTSGASSSARPYRVPVYGHDRAVMSLGRSLGAGRGAQSYLFTGPPGVGKRTVARYIAQALACPDAEPNDGPCGDCRTCRLVRDATFVDLHVLEVPVRIEAVRELQGVLSLAPAESERRVAVVPDVEAASIGAANCLLKTLEEPPSHAVLILTSSAPDRVPATVRSRCRSVALHPLSDSIVAEALRDLWEIDADRASLLAGLADGRIGWAAHALADDAVLAHREAWLDALGEVLTSDVAGRLVHAAGLASSGGDVSPGLAAWRSWWRDVLMVHLGLDAAIVNYDRLSEVADTARNFGVDDVVHSIRLVDEVMNRLAAHANERLALEVLCLGMPR